MTTTIVVQVGGNKRVIVAGGDADDEIVTPPGFSAKRYIHGEQVLTVKETGEFLQAETPVTPPAAGDAT